MEQEPGFMVVGGVPQDWRLQRMIAELTLEAPALPFLDVEAPATHEFLSDTLSSELVGLGYEEPLDISVLTNQDRRLSRLISKYAYTAARSDGTPAYSGIRYMSRVCSQWECWAIFEGTSVQLRSQHPIELNDEALQRIAQLWTLRVF